MPEIVVAVGHCEKRSIEKYAEAFWHQSRLQRRIENTAKKELFRDRRYNDGTYPAPIHLGTRGMQPSFCAIRLVTGIRCENIGQWFAPSRAPKISTPIRNQQYQEADVVEKTQTPAMPGL